MSLSKTVPALGVDELRARCRRGGIESPHRSKTRTRRLPLLRHSSHAPTGPGSHYYVVPSDFFDQLEEEVVRAKSDAGVRVFNLSPGAPGMRRGLGYSVFAQALDDIAAEHDILFVVSAGNLRGTEARAP